MNQDKIRNFAIIAHIDHGKSTLADRILELTNTISSRDLQAQHMDGMDLERERGITIKLNAAQIKYKGYTIHLIDTPGHVDFSYEVSRSLKAAEGVLLLVDATQGIEAQTLANVYLALENNLEIIPIINKIDLPSAHPEVVKQEIEDVIGIPTDHAIEISAKTGKNVDQVLEAIIKYIPAPKELPNTETKALVFDSYYDTYRGVVLLVRVFQGEFKVGSKIEFMATGKSFEVTELGIKDPSEVKKSSLQAGEIGWIAASIRDSKDVSIGDTLTTQDKRAVQAMEGYRKMNPVVFSGFYPVDTRDYPLLRESLEKISLSDSSLTYEQETSQALGYGYRVGFLGMLHMEVIQERLEREYDINVIATAPSVEFELTLTNGEEVTVSNPATMPNPTKISAMREPFIKATIILPEEYLGAIMELAQSKRGKYVSLEYLDDTRRKVIYEVPLVEIVFNFFDKLKSISRGYASFDYELIGYRDTNLVKVDILLNGEQVDAFSFIVHRDDAEGRGRKIAQRLKEVIPRHNFEIPVQAAIGGKVIARETIKAFRKDVTAKLYGGDRTRRDKLLKKQKKGKKRAKEFGRVEVPQDAFIKVLKSDEGK